MTDEELMPEQCPSCNSDNVEWHSFGYESYGDNGQGRYIYSVWIEECKDCNSKWGNSDIDSATWVYW